MTMTTLETLRRNRELTIKQLSAMSGVSTSILHKVEKGYRPVRSTTHAKVARALDMSVAELFPPADGH